MISFMNKFGNRSVLKLVLFCR